MFERAHYKQLAKRQLKGRRAVPALATLITLLIFAFLCSHQRIPLAKKPGHALYAFGVRIYMGARS